MFDPRLTPIADGLYDERSGKTVRIVADISARDAIPVENLYEGYLVQVTADGRTFRWNGSSWRVYQLKAVNRESVSTDVTLTVDSAEVQSLLPNADLTVNLPTTADCAGMVYTVMNRSTDKTISIVDSASNPVVDVTAGTAMTVVCDGSEWAVSSGSGSGGAFVQGNQASVFNNWVLVDRIERDNEPLGTPSISINGNQYDRIKVIAHLSTSTNTGIGLRLNDDSGNNYTRLQHVGGDGHSYNKSTQSYMYMTGTSNSGDMYGECTILPKSGQGQKRIIQWAGSRKENASWTGSQAFYWDNVVDEITTLDFFDFQGSNNMAHCVIEVYAWQEIKPVELHSYELVKEFILNNETVDYDFDLNADDQVKIDAFVYVNTGVDHLVVQLNGDSNSNNYERTYIHGSSSNVDCYVSSADGLAVLFSTTTGRECEGQFIFNNFNNSHSKRKATFIHHYDDKVSLGNTFWANTADDITTAKLYCPSSLTGTIRVYKLAKTHLTSSNPGLLKGMWQRSVDVDTVEVQPGSIEIGGANCNLASAKQVTLSGDLRSGESEAADTYYYLYAVRGDGRSVSFKFSAHAPTMDRFGNTVASFEDCDSEQDWYHPLEGRTWRYVGQVYNDASQDIPAFDKCKPGYWEGTWTIIPGTGGYNILRGTGKIKYESVTMFFSNSSAGDPCYSINDLWESDGYYGWGVQSSSAALDFTSDKLPIWFGGNGIFHDGTTWQTSGYYKLILKV